MPRKKRLCLGAFARGRETEAVGLLGPIVGKRFVAFAVVRTAGAEDTGDHLVTRRKVVGGNVDSQGQRQDSVAGPSE